MTRIPELTAAAKLHARLLRERGATAEGERRFRALLLRAVAAGATAPQIVEVCGMSRERLEAELSKARKETADPKLRKARLSRMRMGEYWCPHKRCPRSEANGSEPFTSVQATAMHRTKVHGDRLGANALTASMVKRARSSEKPTTVLAEQWGVSPGALRAARVGRTWKHLDDVVAPCR